MNGLVTCFMTFSNAESVESKKMLKRETKNGNKKSLSKYYSSVTQAEQMKGNPAYFVHLFFAFFVQRSA